MRRAGKFAILTHEDLTEGLLAGITLDLPEGATKLMLHADLVEYLNDALGFFPEDYDPGKKWRKRLRAVNEKAAKK